MIIGGICPSHGIWKGEECSKCERPKDTAYVGTFTPHLYQDLGPDPVYITSKRQLREECKRRNLTAARLL